MHDEEAQTAEPRVIGVWGPRVPFSRVEGGSRVSQFNREFTGFRIDCDRDLARSPLSVTMDDDVLTSLAHGQLAGVAGPAVEAGSESFIVHEITNWGHFGQDGRHDERAGRHPHRLVRGDRLLARGEGFKENVEPSDFEGLFDSLGGLGQAHNAAAFLCFLARHHQDPEASR